jgi:hypothetical protein
MSELLYRPEQTRAQNAPPQEAVAARSGRRQNLYEGTPLHVSGKLATSIRNSFGISAEELSLRQSPAVAEMGARAAAQGNAIRFAPGEFRPDTRAGMALLGHELNHVREQAMGAVRAPGGELFEHPAYEAASNSAGAAFASGSLSASNPVSLGGMNTAAAPVQGFGLGNFFGNKRKSGKARSIWSMMFGRKKAPLAAPRPPAEAAPADAVGPQQPADSDFDDLPPIVRYHRIRQAEADKEARRLKEERRLERRRRHRHHEQPAKPKPSNVPSKLTKLRRYREEHPVLWLFSPDKQLELREEEELEEYELQQQRQEFLLHYYSWDTLPSGLGDINFDKDKREENDLDWLYDDSDGWGKKNKGAKKRKR